jgi:hypothetical protein
LIVKASVRRLVVAAALLLSVPHAASAAEAPDAKPKGDPWKPAIYLDGYLEPGDAAFLVPTVFLDKGPLHLEARYNYEDLDTGSLFAGYAFSFGEAEKYLKLTPMVGGVVGNVNGIAPGLEVEARWGRLAYWLESEYLIDLEDSSANYLYTWSELNFYALPWLWLGASVQRLKVVETATELDVGPMVGFGKPGSPGWSVSLYAYALTSTPWYLATVAIQF